mgnify:FL=1
MKKNKNKSELRFVICRGMSKEVLRDFATTVEAKADLAASRALFEEVCMRVASKSVDASGNVTWNFL